MAATGVEEQLDMGPTADAGTGEGEDSWHPLQKLLFRFSCIYFAGYAAPNLFELAFRWDPFASSMHRTAVWVGKTILGLDYELGVDSSSGDTLAHYLTVLVLVTVSVAGSLVWTFVDRQRRHYRRLGQWLVVACRFYLLAVMLAYGLAKIFTVQFVPPSLERLLQTYGDSSPMGLHTTAMGYAKAYTVFGGVAELIGGLLLCLRRTTTLGALIIVGVMSNVVVMNFSYDVSVKLYSSHILLLACVLLAQDGRRLLRVFVLNRPTPAVVYPPHFATRMGRIAGRVATVVAIGSFVLLNVNEGIASEQVFGRKAAKPPLWGIYDVETFRLDGEVRPPLLSDASRWQNVIFDTRGRLSVRLMDGRMQRYSAVVDGPGKLSIFPARGSRYLWTYERSSPQTLRLAGEIDERSISLELKARDLDSFRLINRGFHWVSEVPFQF